MHSQYENFNSTRFGKYILSLALLLCAIAPIVLATIPAGTVRESETIKLPAWLHVYESRRIERNSPHGPETITGCSASISTFHGEAGMSVYSVDSAGLKASTGLSSIV